MIKNSNTSSTNMNKGYLFPLILVTSLFFFWGLVHNIDPTLIAHLKKTFTLSAFQASLVDSSVFIAYFIMALPAGWVNKKFGYKYGIIFGLLLFASGAFLFIPIANTHAYFPFLMGLFIIASGLAFLETSANPYVAILGPAETSTFRLNLAQSFNGLAAAVAPILGKLFILKNQDINAEQIQAMDSVQKGHFINEATQVVKTPFLILGLIILIVAILFMFVKLPEVKTENETSKKGLFHALKQSHLKWAVIAQFFYVGAQVCVGSFFLVYAEKASGLDNMKASNYLAIYGILFMIGRFVGTFLLRFVKANILLSIYATLASILTLISIFGSGFYTVFCLLGIAFFMSIMFPTIFSLGIKNLGEDTKGASSLIIMSIVGGALLPPILGYISDVTGNIQYGYIVPFICFLVVLFFGLKGHQTKPKQIN